MDMRSLKQMQKVLSQLEEPDFFACGTTAFHMIKKQIGIKEGCTEFTYNDFTFKLDKNMMPGQVLGVGPKCSAAAEAMSELIKQGKA